MLISVSVHSPHGMVFLQMFHTAAHRTSLLFSFFTPPKMPWVLAPLPLLPFFTVAKIHFLMTSSAFSQSLSFFLLHLMPVLQTPEFSNSKSDDTTFPVCASVYPSTWPLCFLTNCCHESLIGGWFVLRIIGSEMVRRSHRPSHSLQGDARIPPNLKSAVILPSFLLMMSLT